MAQLAAKEVEILAGDDHVIKRQREIVVDKETGVAAEIERIDVAVDRGNGVIGYAQRQRIVALAEFPSKQTPAPPPYTPQPAIQHQPAPKQQHVVIVQPQPAPQRVVVHRSYGTGDHGLVCAVVSTFCVFFCGSWLSLLCTVPAIFLAIGAQEAEARGDESSMQSQRSCSYGMSTAGIFFTVLMWAAVVVVVYVL